jgi:hypothetical protein
MRAEFHRASFDGWAGSGDSLLFQKWDQFIDPKVGEDLAMPVHRRGLGLAGEGDHFLHGFAVTGDYERLDLDFLALEVFDDFVAPWATAFDVKDGQVHVRNGVFEGMTAAADCE